MKLTIASCISMSFALLSILAQPKPGEELFERRCSGCHSLDKDKEGPRLRGVYGRAAGRIPAFEYSNALKATRLTWDADTLDKWLTDPEQLVPGNNMAFRLVKADERAAIVDYLRTATVKIRENSKAPVANARGSERMAHVESVAEPRPSGRRCSGHFFTASKSKGVGVSADVINPAPTQRAGTDAKNALTPFQTIWTPMHTKRNDDSRTITVMAVTPNIRASRSANP
jgi:cytochrome c